MAILYPPSLQLPPIQKIGVFTAVELLNSLAYLRSLYVPEVRGSARRRRKAAASIYKHPSEEKFALSDIDTVRADAFERSYSIRWLTALLAQSHLWETDNLASGCNDADGSHQTASSLIEGAASLLAICAGAAAAGRLTRSFIFRSEDSHRTVSLQLTDAPLDNHDYSSVGAQTWGGACVLAEMVVEQPMQFGFAPADIRTEDEDHFKDINREFRILELGAGTGLVSITVAKLLEGLPGWTGRKITVVATDFQPSVLANLQTNIYANFSTDAKSTSSMISIVSAVLDWSQFSEVNATSEVLGQPFDLIFGADIVYETEHAAWIKGCVEKLLRRPVHDNDNPPIFHLMIPLRSTHSRESNAIKQTFPCADMGSSTPSNGDNLRLATLSKETVFCDAPLQGKRNGVADEVEYAYYRIGWHEARESNVS